MSTPSGYRDVIIPSKLRISAAKIGNVQSRPWFMKDGGGRQKKRPCKLASTFETTHPATVAKVVDLKHVKNNGGYAQRCGDAFPPIKLA